MQENKKLYKCSICLRLLSRKQRIESHLQLVHDKGKLFPPSRMSFDQSLLSSVIIQCETFGFSFVTLLAGPFKRKYKLYVDDSSIPIPRITQV